MKRIFTYYLLLFSLSVSFSVAQEKVSPVTCGADLVSGYIWRGTPFNMAPNFQPWIDLTYKGFSLGAWGSINFTGDFHEPDLYLKYSTSKFSVGLNEYHTDGVDYFNFKKGETKHTLDFFAAYTGKVQFLASVLVLGSDHNIESINLDSTLNFSKDQNYSTYLEVSYPMEFTGFKLVPTLGIILQESYFYGTEDWGIINASIKGTKEIKITDSFSLPVSMSVIVNPLNERVFYVLSISL